MATAMQSMRTNWRLVLLGTVIVALLGLGIEVAASNDMNADTLRAQIDAAGTYGVLVFIAIFIAGQMMHLPGLIFIAAGAFAFGAPVGGPLSLFAATLAVSINFWFIRSVGGQPLAAVKRPLVQKILGNLDAKPFRTVVLLRLVFFTSPAISAGLALTSVRFRDHLVGSVLGMAGPVVGAAFLADVLIR